MPPADHPIPYIMQRVPRQRPQPGRLTASPFLEAGPRSLRIAPRFASRQWVAARYPRFRSISQLLDAGGTVIDAGQVLCERFALDSEGRYTRQSWNADCDPENRGGERR